MMQLKSSYEELLAACTFYFVKLSHSSLHSIRYLATWLLHLNLANPIPYFDRMVTNRFGAPAALNTY